MSEMQDAIILLEGASRRFSRRDALKGIDKRRDLLTDNEHLDVETYNYLAEHLADVTRGTGATAEPDRRLDYIFADAGRVKIIRAGPWKGRRVADMDHDPLLADLQITQNP